MVSRLLLSHCFLSCLMCGSLSCSFANFSSFSGSCTSVLVSMGSVWWMLSIPVSHVDIVSTICVCAGGNSSNGK